MVNLDRKRTDGVPSGLVFACLRTFSALAQKHPFGIQIWCWDGGGRTWRHKACAEYKANRTPWPEQQTRDFDLQASAFQFILGKLGALSVKLPEVEADDLVGVLSHEALLRDCRVVIRSGDQDFYQLLEQGRLVINNGKREVTEESLPRLHGVGARAWVTFRSLTGDSSDGLKGVGGIGPVRAVAAMRGNHLPWTPARRATFARNKELMTILRDKTDTRLPRSIERLVDLVFTSFVFGTRVVASYDALKLVGRWELSELAEELWGFLPLGEERNGTK